MKAARLLFGAPKKARPVLPGDLCLALPDPSESKGPELFLATCVDSKHAIFFDDGSEKTVKVVRVAPATAEDKAAARARYERALAECKAAALADSAEIVAAAV